MKSFFKGLGILIKITIVIVIINICFLMSKQPEEVTTHVWHISQYNEVYFQDANHKDYKIKVPDAKEKYQIGDTETIIVNPNGTYEIKQ